MGAITQDRFNPIKAFCNVRLQQGVPLVDADVNELDDVRKFEVRTFFKWFVGDGVPAGNDGFHIRSTTDPPLSSASAAADDFQIYPGDQLIGTAPTAPSPAANDYALRNFGRCIVDGLEVVIQGNTQYKAQPLYTGNATAAQLSTTWGVPQVAPIPNVAGQVVVYLDVWERIVVADEDKDLVVPPLNTETCARIKREWVVRTRTGNTVPVTGNTDFLANHSYCALALINRKVTGTTPQPIADGDITDQRRTGLSLASQGGATFSGLVTANGGLTVNNGLTVSSGMLTANGGVTVPSSGKLTVGTLDVGAAITGLQTTTATQGTNITSLQTTVSGHTSAISTLQTTTATQGTNITSLQTTVSGHTSAISTLQTTTATQGTNITSLQTTVSGHTSAISTLQTTTATQGTNITALQTTTATQGTNITALQNTTASQGSAITALQTTTGQNTTDINTIKSGTIIPSGNGTVTLGLLQVVSSGAGSNPTVTFVINGSTALTFPANKIILRGTGWSGP